MNTINPFSSLQRKFSDAKQSHQKIDLGEIGQELLPIQINIITQKLLPLAERINILNQTFNLSTSQHSPDTVSSHSPDQSTESLEQKINSMRTQLLDLGRAITAQMAAYAFRLVPSKAGQCSKPEDKNNAWQNQITALSNFLFFLEVQAERLKEPRLLSKKSMPIDINSFFQKSSIEYSSDPFIFTLNIRLAILSEKFSSLENNLTPSRSATTSYNGPKLISHDIQPGIYKILDEMSETRKKIEQAPKEIANAKSKILEQAMAVAFGS